MAGRVVAVMYLSPLISSVTIGYGFPTEVGEDNIRGSAVARATLERGGDSAALSNVEVIWRQMPKTSGRGHYSHRMAFTPDGKLLIISDDRQMQDLAEDFSVNLGKLIRINLDGNVPANNPFRIAANWRKAPGPWGTAIS